MFRRNFLFGVDSGTANVIGVTKEDIYYPGKGYGFVTELNRREQELLKISELNAGFDTVYWYQDEVLTHVEDDEDGCFLDSNGLIRKLEENAGEKMEGEHRRIPLSFKINVPRQGNYKVIIEIRSEEAMDEVLLFTGRRRLAYKGSIAAGGCLKHTVMVNICDIVPRGKNRIYADKTLDLTVVADKPRISAVSILEASCSTVYIAGDSTLTDQSAEYPYAPGTSYSGWGQMLTAFMNNKIGISNHSHSGLTTDSFRKEGHYAVIDQYSKPRDFFFFQFGHNDQKLNELKAREGYRYNLLRYINECREKEAYPVLITPVARNSWKGNDGAYNDLLKEYADACLETGEITDTPVLDLHKVSMEFIKNNGLEKVKGYFYPNDFTHTNDYGAYKMAELVAGEIVRVCGKHPNFVYRFLAGCVTGGFGDWPVPERVVLPEKPKIYEDIINPFAEGELLADVDRRSEPADRASVLDMIIKTARFFPTNVYNNMFVDVVGHEWYAGTVECAYQNGIIQKELTEDKFFYPEHPVTLEEFIIFAMNGYRSRKRLPGEVPCAYDNKCVKYARIYVRAACSIGLLPADGSSELGRNITRGQAVEMCRALKI